MGFIAIDSMRIGSRDPPTSTLDVAGNMRCSQDVMLNQWAIGSLGGNSNNMGIVFGGLPGNAAAMTQTSVGRTSINSAVGQSVQFGEGGSVGLQYARGAFVGNLMLAGGLDAGQYTQQLRVQNAGTASNAAQALLLTAAANGRVAVDTNGTSLVLAANGTPGLTIGSNGSVTLAGVTAGNAAFQNAFFGGSSLSSQNGCLAIQTPCLTVNQQTPTGQNTVEVLGNVRFANSLVRVEGNGVSLGYPGVLSVDGTGVSGGRLLIDNTGKAAFGGPVTVGGPLSLSSQLNMLPNQVISLNGDTNHTLQFDATLDGPRLQGFAGGVLGTTQSTTNAFSWSPGNCSVGLPLTVVPPMVCGSNATVVSGDPYLGLGRRAGQVDCELAVATSTNQHSNVAVTGDVVLKSRSGGNVIVQSSNSGPAVYVNSNNAVAIQTTSINPLVALDIGGPCHLGLDNTGSRLLNVAGKVFYQTIPTWRQVAVFYANNNAGNGAVLTIKGSCGLWQGVKGDLTLVVSTAAGITATSSWAGGVATGVDVQVYVTGGVGSVWIQVSAAYASYNFDVVYGGQGYSSLAAAESTVGPVGNPVFSAVASSSLAVSNNSVVMGNAAAVNLGATNANLVSLTGSTMQYQTAIVTGNLAINTVNPVSQLHVLPSTSDTPAVNPDAVSTLLAYEDCSGTSIAGGTLNANATYAAGNGYITLTPAGQIGRNGQLNYILNPGAAFDVTFEIFTVSTGGTQSEGFCFTVFNNQVQNAAFGGVVDIFQNAQKASGYCLTLCDSATNPGSTNKSAYLFWNATLLASQPVSNFQMPVNAWTQVRINFVRNVWRVWVGNQPIFSYQDVSRVLVGPNTYSTAFNAQVGGISGGHLIRNVQISKHAQGPWRPTAGGNTVGLQYCGPVSVVGNLAVTGPANVTSLQASTIFCSNIVGASNVVDITGNSLNYTSGNIVNLVVGGGARLPTLTSPTTTFTSYQLWQQNLSPGFYLGNSLSTGNSGFITFNAGPPAAANSLGIGVFGMTGGGITVSYPSGNVGIGYSTPQYTLDVAGTGRITNLLSTQANVTSLGASTLYCSNIVGYQPNLADIAGNSATYSYYRGGVANLSAVGAAQANITSLGVGTLSAATLLNAGALAATAYSINLAAAVGSYTQICNSNDPQATSTYMIRVVLVQARTSNALLKSYSIPVTASYFAGSFLRCIPEFSLGASSGNDFALDVYQYSPNGAIYLRAVRTGSGTGTATGLTAYVTVTSDTGFPISFGYDGATGTGATNAGLYAGCPMGCTAGNVGILTASPAYPLDVAGTARVTTLLASNVQAAQGNVASLGAGTIFCSNVISTQANVTSLGASTIFCSNVVGNLISAQANVTSLGAGTIFCSNVVGLFIPPAANLTNISGNSANYTNLISTQANVTSLGAGTIFCSNVVGLFIPPAANLTNISGNSANYTNLISTQANVTSLGAGTIFCSNVVGLFIPPAANLTNISGNSANYTNLISTQANVTSLGAGTIFCSNVVGLFIPPAANLTNISGNSVNYSFVTAANVLLGITNYGYNTVGKEVNAGKIGYGTFSSGGSLDVVGAGPVAGSRNVQIYDSLTVNTGLGNGSITAGSVQLIGNVNATYGSIGTLTVGNLVGYNSVANVQDITGNSFNYVNGKVTGNFSVFGSQGISGNLAVYGSQGLLVQSSNATPLVLAATGGGVNNPIGLGFQTYLGRGLNNCQIGAVDDGSFSGHLVLSTANSGSGTNAPIERMRITSGGLVGIGTSGPQNTLDVAGNARVTGLLTVANISGPLTVIGSSAYNTHLFQGQGATSICLGPALQNFQSGFISYNNPFAPGNNNGSVGIGVFGVSQGITVAPTGNVGINQTAPQAQLDVVGNARVTGTIFQQASTPTLLFGSSATANSAGFINFNQPGQPGYTNSIGIGVFGATPGGITVSPNGSVGISNPQPIASTSLDIYGTTRMQGNIIVTGSSAMGAVIGMPSFNIGDWVSTNYTPSTLSDRYGIGQYNNGQMRIFGSSYIPQAAVSMSLAGSDSTGGGGSFQDIVTASNTAITLSRRVFSTYVTTWLYKGTGNSPSAGAGAYIPTNKAMFTFQSGSKNAADNLFATDITNAATNQTNALISFLYPGVYTVTWSVRFQNTVNASGGENDSMFGPCYSSQFGEPGLNGNGTRVGWGSTCAFNTISTYTGFFLRQEGLALMAYSSGANNLVGNYGHWLTVTLQQQTAIS